MFRETVLQIQETFTDVCFHDHVAFQSGNITIVVSIRLSRNVSDDSPRVHTLQIWSWFCELSHTWAGGVRKGMPLISIPLYLPST
jgi:hypothetical protein